jgi:hypothetical protein
MTMNPNLVVAPPFPHGEIVNAYLIRVVRFCGSQSLSLACRRLLNRRPGLDGMPSSLGLFHEEIGHLYGSIDTLIDKHTEYHFYCCGLPRGKFASQRARLIEMHQGPVRLCRLPLLFSVSENTYLQCPECAEQQKKEFGFAFIHRRMGAPFVNVCSVHGIPLRPDRGQLPLFDARCQSKPTNYQIQMTRELGKRIEYCMETPVEKSKHHKNDVVQLLKVSGWIGANERMHASEFQKEFSNFFAGAFSDARLDIMCQSETHVLNALRALLGNEKALHPEWCVLFTWFAEEQHFNSPKRRTPDSAESLRKRISSPNETPSHETVAAAFAEHRTLDAAAKVLGISTVLLSSLCKRYDIAVKWRPKKLDKELSNQVKEAFNNGKSAAEVAKKCGIAVVTAYRQRAAFKDVPLPSEKAKADRTEADKKAWLQLIQENPGAGRTALRDLDPRLYMRLYRSSKAWFDANQPPLCPVTNGARALPPERLVCNLNNAVADADEFCTAPEHSRINKSRFRLRELTRVTDHALRKCLEKGLVEQREETRREFTLARIARIAQRFGRPMNLPTARQASLAVVPAVANTEVPASVAKLPTPDATGTVHVADGFTEQLELLAAQLDSIGEKPSVFAKKVGLREETIRKVLTLKKRT